MKLGLIDKATVSGVSLHGTPEALGANTVLPHAVGAATNAVLYSLSSRSEMFQ